MDNSTIVKFSQDRLKFTLYLAPVLALLLVIISILNQSNNDFYRNVFWLFYAVVLLFASKIAYNKLYKIKYAMKFCDQGVSIFDGYTAVDLLPWTEITKVKKQSALFSTYILLFANDGSVKRADQSFLKKLKMKWCIYRYGTPFVVNVDKLEFMYSRVAQIIESELKTHSTGVVLT